MILTIKVPDKIISAKKGKNSKIGEKMKMKRRIEEKRGKRRIGERRKEKGENGKKGVN